MGNFRKKVRAFINTPTFLRIIAVFVSGLLITIACVLLGTQATKKKRCTESVKAVVTEYKTHKGVKRGSGTTYAPVFEYVYKGEYYKSSTYEYTKPPVFDKGEETYIYVNPDDPEEIFAPADHSRYIASFILLGVAPIIFIMLFFVIPPNVFKGDPKEEYVSYENNSGQ